ncbi:hypothetical protein Syun_016408 [Stephania yunnanensis]|uniref:Argonaute linker 1 domain-containing protein n=1 Tax=Stephania yunnanensis TaxID=152371 RepID=A0AAP0J4U1_9MAGN
MGLYGRRYGHFSRASTSRARVERAAVLRCFSSSYKYQNLSHSFLLSVTLLSLSLVRFYKRSIRVSDRRRRCLIAAVEVVAEEAAAVVVGDGAEAAAEARWRLDRRRRRRRSGGVECGGGAESGGGGEGAASVDEGAASVDEGVGVSGEAWAGDSGDAVPCEGESLPCQCARQGSPPLRCFIYRLRLSLKVSLVSFLSLRSASVVFPLWVLELLLSLMMMIRAQGFPSFDCRVHFDMGFSQRSFRFHFCFGLKKRSQESVAITPEVISRGVNRTILNQLIKDYGQKHLGNLLPAYDGRKSLYTAGPLPFTSKEFTVKLVNEDGQSTRRERTFKVAIKFAARADLHHLRQFLSGRQMDSAHDTIQVLDVVLRESPSKSCVVVGRSFFSEIYGPRNAVGEGLECWRGYYQSLRPTQMGLSLNIGRDPVNELSAK